MTSILDIEEVIENLSEKELFNRFFHVSKTTGKLKVPEEMKGWVEKTFGSVEKVESQDVVKVLNRFTFESSLFNALRAERPMDASSESSAAEEIGKAEGGPFCNAETGTPEDVFGRVKGENSVTASNVAKYDKWHGLVVFDEHNPLKFTEESISDYLTTAEEWLKKCNNEDESAKYPYILWNCLWRSGSSIIHGHMQTLVTSEHHYGNLEFLNRVSSQYKKKYGSDYFEDYLKVHKSAGLASGNIISHLVPKKEKEIIIFSESLSELAKPLYKALSAYREMGVESFNVGIALPAPGWDFPVMARIIDRGDLGNRTTDFGAMEIFAGSSVVSSDPFKLIKKLED